MSSQISNGSSARAEEAQVLPRKYDGVTEAERDSEADRIEIKRLHDSILDKARRSLEEGIRIGEILVKRKGKCGHGNFKSWLDENVEFTARTARRYMDLFLYRELLKSDNVSDLTTGAKVIKSAKFANRLAKATVAKKLLGRGSEKPNARPDRSDNIDETSEDTAKLQESAPGPDTSAQARDPELRTRAINALCGQPLLISKQDACKLVDAAEGDTEAHIIESALRLHGQAKLPGQMSKLQTDKEGEDQQTMKRTTVKELFDGIVEDALDGKALEPERAELLALIKEGRELNRALADQLKPARDLVHTLWFRPGLKKTRLTISTLEHLCGLTGSLWDRIGGIAERCERMEMLVTEAAHGSGKSPEVRKSE